jgi:hypothetical protein
LLFWLKVL